MSGVILCLLRHQETIVLVNDQEVGNLFLRAVEHLGLRKTKLGDKGSRQHLFHLHFGPLCT